MTTALTDPSTFQLHDVDERDVRDDPQWRALLGWDDSKAVHARHTPGGHPHNQLSHAGPDLPDIVGALEDLIIYDADDYWRDFGDEMYSETTKSGLCPRIFEGGGAHLALDLPDNNFQVLANLEDSEGMEGLAATIRDVLDLDLDSYGEQDEDEDGLIYRATDSLTDMELGRYLSGDVYVRTGEGARMDISQEEAEDLADKLDSVAEVWDSEFEYTESQRDVPQLRHLPGKHSQDSHGNDVGVDLVKNPLDRLRLAGRIKLGPGERLVASGKAAPGTPFAVTHSDGGNRLRLGIVGEGDERQWRGRRLGGTVVLDQDGIDELRRKAPNVAESAQGYREEMRELAEEIEEFDGFNADRSTLTPGQLELLESHDRWRDGFVFEKGVLAEGPDDSLMYEIQGDDDLADDESVRVIVGVRSEDEDHETWEITDGTYHQYDQDEFEAWVKKLVKVLDGAVPTSQNEPTTGRSRAVHARHTPGGRVASRRRLFDESKHKRDRKGRFAEMNAAAVLGELDDLMAKLAGLSKHMSDDEKSDLDNALDYLKSARESRHDIATKGKDFAEVDTQQYTNPVEFNVDRSDGTVSVDFEGGGFVLTAVEAEEIAEAIDDLSAVDVDEVDLPEDPGQFVQERTTSSGGFRVVLWETGVLEIGTSDSKFSDDEDDEGTLLIDPGDPDDARRIADALEELAETAAKHGGDAQTRTRPRSDPDRPRNDAPEVRSQLGKTTEVGMTQTATARRPSTTRRRRARDENPGRTHLGLCTRAFDFELDGASGDGRTLEGYAAVFDTPARIRDLQGDFDEVIRPGAFERSLERRMPVMQWDHGKDPRIGTAPIGDIHELREDGHGLYVRARLYDHPDIERVRLAIKGKSVRGMSFRFGVPNGGDKWSSRSGDVDLREIREADTHELGPVVFPAYDSTSVSVRSILSGLDAAQMRELVHELSAYLRDAVDLTDLTGRPGARSAGGGDFDGRAPSPLPTHLRADHDALRLRGIIR